MAIPKGKQWVNQIFNAKAARNGGVLRRKVASVQKYASYGDLHAEVLKRGFHLLRIGDKISGQYVILCNPGNMKVIC